MSYLRAARRIIATALGATLFGLGVTLLTIILVLGLTPLPVRRVVKRRWTRRTMSWAAGCYLRAVRLLGLINFELRDLEGLNRPGQVVVANHPSLLDALFLMWVIPDARFVVKAAVSKNPFTRALVSLAGYLPNSVFGPALISKAVSSLHEGQILVIFPEGTRTPDLQQLVFQRGAANIALQATCPIQPVVISCTPPFLRKNEHWYKLPAQIPRFCLYGLQPLHIENCIDTRQPAGIQARQLTRQLQNKFSAQLQLRP